MTKKRGKMSFRAGRVESGTKIWIIGIVIDFTEMPVDQKIRRGGFGMEGAKRKITAIGLCMMMFLCSLAGCGDKENFGTAESRTAQEDPSENTIENVSFDMDIVIDADLSEETPVIAKARMKKADAGQAFDLLFSDSDTYDTYEYEEKDEYGNKVKTGTYVSPEETTLSYGPVSSQMTYMRRTSMRYIRSAFVLDEEDERYNADLFSKEGQLSFMDRKDALQIVSDALTKINMQFEYDSAGYAVTGIS